MLHEAAFGEDTPLGASIYNYNLNKLSVDDIMQYRMHNYNAHNVTGAAQTSSPLDYTLPDFSTI